MTSKTSTLCSGHYMQVIKSLGHHLSDRWSRCTSSRYIEGSFDRTTTWLLQRGDRFEKGVVKTSLTLYLSVGSIFKRIT